jgi:hypothetical protein
LELILLPAQHRDNTEQLYLEFPLGDLPFGFADLLLHFLWWRKHCYSWGEGRSRDCLVVVIGHRFACKEERGPAAFSISLASMRCFFARLAFPFNSSIFASYV